MVVYFLTSGHRFNKPQQPTKDYLVSWSSYRRQRPQFESVASKAIKGEIFVLFNAPFFLFASCWPGISCFRNRI